MKMPILLVGNTEVIEEASLLEMVMKYPNILILYLSAIVPCCVD
jgi:hypothetical protein